MKKPTIPETQKLGNNKKKKHEEVKYFTTAIFYLIDALTTMIVGIPLFHKGDVITTHKVNAYVKSSNFTTE